MGILKLKYKRAATSNNCGGSISYTGGMVFPLVKKVLMSQGAGFFALGFSTTGTPTRIKVYLKDTKVFVSPYIGLPTFQAQLDAFNNDRGLPIETIQDVLSFSTNLTKTAEEQVLKIEVFCPLNNNSVSVNIPCVS